MAIDMTTEQGNANGAHYDDFHKQSNSRQVDVMQPKLTIEDE